VNANESHTPAGQQHAAHEKTGVTIYIDRKPYHIASATFTGAELRNLVVPPIGADKVIFRVVSGKGDDIRIADADTIAVNMRETNQGRHFFSDTVIPSKDEIARRAYFIYQQEGSQPGHDAENWAKAEAQVPVLKEARRKETEAHAAKTPSPNLNEAVEKSIVKKSADEVRAKPN
jgi:hypothetical protein